MLELIINEYDREILVTWGEMEFLKVVRKTNFGGRMSCSFYRDGHLVLKTNTHSSLFKRSADIEYQDLESSISLVNGNHRSLTCVSSTYATKTRLFRRPHIILCKDNLPCGQIEAKSISLGEPIWRRMTFTTDDPSNFYLLLVFLIFLPQPGPTSMGLG